MMDTPTDRPELEERLRQLGQLVDRYRDAILDIDAHATPLGDTPTPDGG